MDEKQAGTQKKSQIFQNSNLIFKKRGREIDDFPNTSSMTRRILITQSNNCFVFLQLFK